MTSSGGNNDDSSSDYQAKPGYGEFPSLPPEGYGVSPSETQSSPEVPGYTTPNEQYPGYPPPSYNPTGNMPEPGGFGEPNPYLPPQTFSPPNQYPANQYQQPGQYGQAQYGQPPNPYGQPNQFAGGYAPPMRPVGTNGLAIASLVVSLAGGCFYSLGGIVGIILGIVALNQIKQTGQEGRGLAIAGIAVGATFLAIFAVILVVALIASASSPY
ncbi:DUF4190 domain-containing protein [Rhodococcus erythropolis]|uniref:DUF4190 domain-containing protein n=1 Tax=Rhodococcus erythropolis TaxID=1833 RepID=UPI001BE9FC0C|nr:DUF4190 domain-containing protein [Rhodococcus erythropolis]MBT2268575.1 DUF4190 domain-containing protein [Rhodococcus erythropolis]